MDFFKSILSDDPDPETLANPQQSDPDDSSDSNSNVTSAEDGYSGIGGASGAGIWSFGDLVKTLTTKSESVFETYRKDLKEFRSGLKKESDLFRDVAIRAINELPEVGTSVIKSTADNIISVISSNDVSDHKDSESESVSLSARNVSRFDAKLSAIRSDMRTYIEDVEDVEDFEKWKLGFAVGDKKEEIEKLVGEGGELAEIYEKCVPGEVDDGTFWFRYFYKVYRLEVQEEMRAKLVKRSLLSVDDEEELSWDVDNDEEEEEVKRKSSVSVDEGKEMREVTKTTDVVSGDKDDVEKMNEVSGNVDMVEKGESVLKSDEMVEVEPSEVKDGNVPDKKVQPLSQEEEDLEWDEIEDIGDNDDKKVSHGDSPNKDELRKRLSTAVVDDEEDLSWDIEDDDGDEPAKAGNK